jgi:hypothetical protein
MCAEPSIGIDEGNSKASGPSQPVLKRIAHELEKKHLATVARASSVNGNAGLRASGATGHGHLTAERQELRTR